ncbi:hypothetical protein SARC_05282 [Sphaeroforma arctica JP610]|uniref:Ribosomal L1 domain-containing protein 1 n=1 Tax=Sphaeroforma arctica JP610 TaxID=667725 RepID=A0A0L0FZZ1_9EUKA|nr:hypothetical protein SARC_05282 [Sphaeroforma arctica JP610]KNC82432.1 hypothetical protein SARC_05282 [Sphaeroforma arctica JP610]|eukprot:XP_014156334.1 hypothetical protein SARC_05282 [Sphaeroforma arctica JP610]
MSIDSTLLKKAVPALLKASKAQLENSSTLLQDDQQFLLFIAVDKIPDPKKKVIQIPVPHPFSNEQTEICLITKDPQTGEREWKDKVAEQKVPNVAKVVSLSKLKTKFKTYESKRTLCDSYDLFMADDRIMPSLPHLLGKYFFGKKKMPIGVNLRKENMVKEIVRARDCTQMRVGLGNCITIKVGTTGQSAEDVVANVQAVVDAAIPKIDGKWKNIKSIGLRTQNSVCLPLYNALVSEIKEETKTPTDDSDKKSTKRRRDESDSAVVEPVVKETKASVKKAAVASKSSAKKNSAKKQKVAA